MHASSLSDSASFRMATSIWTSVSLWKCFEGGSEWVVLAIVTRCRHLLENVVLSRRYVFNRSADASTER